MVHYRNPSKDMIQNEPMLYALERYRRNFRDAKAFEDTHRRVHYCCYGPSLCPICPAIESLETALGDLEWLLIKLKKKYSIEITRHVHKNKTWSWTATMRN